MRYKARVKNRDGMIHTRIENGESWGEVNNRLINCRQVERVISVRSVANIPLGEQLELDGVGGRIKTGHLGSNENQPLSTFRFAALSCAFHGESLGCVQ